MTTIPSFIFVLLVADLLLSWMFFVLNYTFIQKTVIGHVLPLSKSVKQINKTLNCISTYSNNERLFVVNDTIGYLDKLNRSILYFYKIIFLFNPTEKEKEKRISKCNKPICLLMFPQNALNRFWQGNWWQTEEQLHLPGHTKKPYVMTDNGHILKTWHMTCDCIIRKYVKI